VGIFGRVQAGSGARFSSKGKPPEDSGYQPDVTSAQIDTPPAPAQYRGLKSGPDIAFEYESNETPAIDASNRLLRSLSPFMIQVEPPLITAGSPDVYGGKKDVAGIYDGGHSHAPSAFRAGRNAILQDIPGGPRVSDGGSVERFVSQGMRTAGAGGNSAKSEDPKGVTSDRQGAPAIADLYTAVDITMQLRALVSTPPLILLINPQSLSKSFTKIQQFSDRTRFGFVFQAWGEEQPKLSISAKCGAFVAGGKGVQFASRRDSASWQNLQTAFQFYRHNGYIYDTVGKSNAHHMVGALSIHYDGWVYYGNMESFTYGIEEANQQGGIVFDMEFTVNAMVDTSKQSLVVTPMRSPVPSPSDPRYAGLSNRGKQTSSSDISVGGPDGVRVGASAYYSRQGTTTPSATTPDGQAAQVAQAPAGGVTAPRGTGGFVAATTTVAAVAVDPAERLPVPFSIRG
jgi:hypothetical protein